ncbi:glycosyltransferase family 2 protein [Candidatus Deferrimicrobium sp.]|uniref:glycosyltransferase family 2 protein n=1 Tax=Candidatus Deferrimicrobium sp. TaxID=3060586 RepID=UPI0027235339|nr:glycosyltransferase family 2 protein [Candidatus Deferrimicrobium sp.]MDO8737729.1 glycosyltransferase family 2 protein [Candidatus Deferrimicrobium sp.]
MDFPVCGIVVTYDCGPGVGPTIRSILQQVDRVIVVDNGSKEETRSFLEGMRAENPETIELILFPENVGIAGALNAGMRRGIELEYPWVLTMDHDSVADGGMVEALWSAVLQDADPEKILLAAPVYVDRNTREEGRLYRYEGWKRRRLFPGRTGRGVNPTVVITSGNLVNAVAYLALGGFDESLAIDYVDHDFCLRGNRAGYRILVAGDGRLMHTVGAATFRRMFGRVWVSTNHPAERRYTIGRNRMTVIRRHARAFPAYALHIALEYPADIAAMLICETGLREKLRALLAGAIDSLRNAKPSRGRGVP